MGSKLSTGAFGTSKILRTTCKCSAVMLIFGSLPKLCSAASTSGEKRPELPEMAANALSLSASDVSFDTAYRMANPMSPLERRINKQINDILDEVAPPRAASPKKRKPRKSVRSYTADAPSRSSAPTPPRKKTPIPETRPTEDVAHSPSVEAMELQRQYSLNSVPDGSRSPPALEIIETPKSADVGPPQIDYARFSFFKKWIQEFEAENGPDVHITDADLKAKVEALIAEDPDFESTIQNIKTKEDWDATGARTETQELGTYRFPDYEDAIRRVLEYKRRENERALRKAKKERKKPSKKQNSGGFSFDFNDDNTDWTVGAF